MKTTSPAIAARKPKTPMMKKKKKLRATPPQRLREHGATWQTFASQDLLTEIVAAICCLSHHVFPLIPFIAYEISVWM